MYPGLSSHRRTTEIAPLCHRELCDLIVIAVQEPAAAVIIAAALLVKVVVVLVVMGVLLVVAAVQQLAISEKFTIIITVQKIAVGVLFQGLSVSVLF